jgi:hypothetical protein
MPRFSPGDGFSWGESVLLAGGSLGVAAFADFSPSCAWLDPVIARHAISQEARCQAARGIARCSGRFPSAMRQPKGLEVMVSLAECDGYIENRNPLDLFPSSAWEQTDGSSASLVRMSPRGSRCLKQNFRSGVPKQSLGTRKKPALSIPTALRIWAALCGVASRPSP